MILKSRALAVFMTLFLACTMYIQAQPKALFDKASELYNANELDSAIILYESLIEEQWTSKELHFNLANCYFKSNQIGPAILHYEKALLLDPKYEAAINNRELAQKRVIDDIEVIPEMGIKRFFRALLSVFSLNIWSWLSIVAAFAFIALNSLLFILGRRIQLIRSIWICFFLWLFFVGATFWSRQLTKDEWVLLSDNAYIKSGPSESSADLYILHAGTKVQRLDNSKDGQWMQLKLEDGHVGWGEKSHFGSVH